MLRISATIRTFANDMSKRREKSKTQNTINRQLEQPELKVKEKDENLIQLGKFFYTLSSMTYAGTVLTFVFDEEERSVAELSWSTALFVTLALIGWTIHKIGNIKR